MTDLVVWGMALKVRRLFKAALRLAKYLWWR